MLLLLLHNYRDFPVVGMELNNFHLARGSGMHAVGLPGLLEAGGKNTLETTMPDAVPGPSRTRRECWGQGQMTSLSE